MAKKQNKTFRTEIYFVRGKMKKRRIPLIDGVRVDEFIRQNADEAFLLENGCYEILHEREMQRAQTGAWLTEETKKDAASSSESANDDDVPF